jgi:molecular chaperone HtpG
MNAPSPPPTADALEALVHQFTDPLAFLRELVQNAIDAGSAEVDVHVEYHDEVLEIRVDDYGEGMDRRIIDTRLTRLFASSKEGDQTKIGRFGVGFVSVFAIEPDAVVLDTARGGECWRVLFRADRTFERIALRTPVDGTKIRILKRANRSTYEELRRRVPEVLARYCRYAQVEIRFDGRPVNEPFDLDSPCKIALHEDGSDFVVGYAVNEARGGYYNRGLTLLEEPLPEQLWSFRINSRHLEHTLARDNVLRDEHHDALVARARALGEQALPALLFERLEQVVVSEQEEAAAVLYELAARQIAAWGGAGADDFAAVAERRVARTEGGEPLGLRALVQLAKGGTLVLAAAPDAITEALIARGDRPLSCPPQSALPELLRALGIEPVDAGAAFFLPLSPEEPPAGKRFAAALLELLRKGGASPRAIRFGRLDHAGSSAAGRIAIVQRNFGELTAMSEACRAPFDMHGERFDVTVNALHPTVARLIELAEHEPELAAHLCCKLLLVGGDLSPLRDSRLALHALEARWQRSRA